MPRHHALDPASLRAYARHAAGSPSDGGARHARTLPRASVGVVAVAAVLLSLPTGASVAAITGGITPEQAGPFGPVVAALPVLGEGGVVGITLRDRTDPVGEPGVVGASGTDEPAVPDAAASPASVDPAAEWAGEVGAPVMAVPAAPSPSPSVSATPQPSVSPQPGAPAPTASAPAGETGPGVLTAAAAAVVDLTNAERAAAGCPPLTVDERLTAAARLHSEDMAAQDYFDHTSLDGRSPWDRAKAQGYTNPSGENIAAGQDSAEAVVKAWMDSPGHRANILNCDFREIGVGEVDRIWTQMFGWG